MMFCTECGRTVPDDAIFCPHCGRKIGVKGVYEGNIFEDYGDVPVESPRKRTTATALAIFGGMFGAHNFYLGNTKKALSQLALGLMGFPFVSAIWGWTEAAKLSNHEIETDASGKYLQD
jgi:DNA-directed RNA polymerase subunit RPC12/RpoP